MGLQAELFCAAVMGSRAGSSLRQIWRGAAGISTHGPKPFFWGSDLRLDTSAKLRPNYESWEGTSCMLYCTRISESERIARPLRSVPATIHVEQPQKQCHRSHQYEKKAAFFQKKKGVAKQKVAGTSAFYRCQERRRVCRGQPSRSRSFCWNGISTCLFYTLAGQKKSTETDSFRLSLYVLCTTEMVTH